MVSDLGAFICIYPTVFNVYSIFKSSSFTFQVTSESVRNDYHELGNSIRLAQNDTVTKMKSESEDEIKEENNEDWNEDYGNLMKPEAIKVDKLQEYVNLNLEEGRLEQEFSVRTLFENITLRIKGHELLLYLFCIFFLGIFNMPSVYIHTLNYLSIDEMCPDRQMLTLKLKR